jgi:putative DNA primase/helicase
MSDVDGLFSPEDDMGDADLIVAAPGNPMAVARQFLKTRFIDNGGAPLLLFHRGGWHRWTGTCWPEAEERRIRADIYGWLEQANYWKPANGGRDVELVPFEPTRYKVANVLEALQAVAHIDAAVTPPAWLDGHEQPAAGAMVAMENGLLDMPGRALIDHTPAFYAHHSLPFAYEPRAAKPRRWLWFLHELWEDDAESIDTLAEIMGYTLSGDTRQQKIFSLIGPKRSGKGTIGRVLTGLLGQHNTTAPTLSSLTTNFGLSPLIGKPLALVSDARLGTRVDRLVAVERLLSISGEDTLTVDRKYREPWTGRLPTRFLILTNELPNFTDASGALASRFVLLILTRSFYDREDPMLTETLLGEAPGIFNWALEGLDRLLERGHFSQPRSAREALRHLEDLSSPTGAYVRDLCVVGPALVGDKDALYEAWKGWCEQEGRPSPGNKSVFVRDLRAAVPGLRPTRPWEGGRRRHRLQGIDLARNHPQPRGPESDDRVGDPGPPQTTLELEPGPVQDHPTKKPHNDAGSPGWSGVRGTVASKPDEIDPDEVERLAERAREWASKP